MRHLRLRRHCRQVIDRLDIPQPFDVQELCSRIAAQRQRPIDLVAVVMPPGSSSGVWVGTANRDYILYERRTTPLHQEHIIVHELGHLLGEQGDKREPTRLLSLEEMRLLLPDLDAAMISRVLHRATYSAEEEKVAETIATMILEQVNRWRPTSEWDTPEDGADIRRRISYSFEPSPDRWRQ